MKLTGPPIDLGSSIIANGPNVGLGAEEEEMMMSSRKTNGIVFYFILLFWTSLGISCTTTKTSEPGFTILGINDVYRIEGVDKGANGGLARVRSLRIELEKDNQKVLLLHGGDFLFPSLLSRQYNGEQMIDVLNLMDGRTQGFDDRMFVTFGTHEFDKGKENEAVILNSRIQESQFPWVGSNIVFKAGKYNRPLISAEHLVDRAFMRTGGVQVGLFSLTTDINTPDYVARFDNPVDVAQKITRRLRKNGAEFVIALTHQPIDQDTALLNALGDDGPDLVIGGYDHYKKSQQVNGRWILKADADARTAAVVRVYREGPDRFDVQWEFKNLSQNTVTPDPFVQERVDIWIRQHSREYCQRVLNSGPRCLKAILGKADIDLIADELEMRRYETNFGNWMVDQALKVFEDQGAQVAFINAGALRLNQDIPDESLITRRDIEHMFAYPNKLKLLRIKGSTLQQIISHAVEDWTGRGFWLQISGFAFRHNPEIQKADSLTLLTPDGPRPIQADEELLAVTNSYLAEGGDGYHWLSSEEVMNVDESPDLKEVVIKNLLAELEEGIAPEVEGRICNTTRQGPCKAILPD
ncbi:MAG: bifunctional metallophosphatase/5'-nucleotidase [Nitrospirota bacterium]|nr:MAG: bifunctional metallophosphatase/5'-nucleotidase [Nitrospirota bacterium]